jgi:hypothetical protein
MTHVMLMSSDAIGPRRAHHRLVRLKWDASPWLLVPVPFLAAPAASLWIAAAVQAVGAGAPLDSLIASVGALGPGVRPVGLLLVFFAVPAVAFALAFFGFLDGDLAVADWTIDARLRLPRPPWRVTDVVAATLFFLTTLLVLAMAAHGISG